MRWAVATGLAGNATPEAVEALIELMEDPDGDVRNWATFSLGISFDDVSECLGTFDSPAIRAALRNRLNDPSAEVRDEAIWGLARRRDHCALQLLLQRLDSEQWIAGDEMVAAEILDKDSKTPVEELRIGLRALLESISND